PNALGKPDKNRFPDQEVTNIEFGELWYRSDRADHVEGEPVARMNLQPKRRAFARRDSQPLQFRITLRMLLLKNGIAISTRMQFHNGRPKRARGLKLALLSIDEERYANARIAQPLDDRCKVIVKPGRIQPAFRRHLFAPLR